MWCFVLCTVCSISYDEPVARDQQPAGATAAETAVSSVEAGQGLTTPRPLFEIHKELRRMLRDEAVGKDGAAWQSNVVELVKLYAEITRDDRLITSDVLNGYRVKLRSRLLKIQRRLERDLGSRTTESDSSGKRAEPEPPRGAQGGAAVDDGAGLVELIQRTISPDFWDVNGGPGTIVYYRQWHVLVIRATPEIHRRVGGAVGGGRK